MIKTLYFLLVFVGILLLECSLVYAQESSVGAECAKTSREKLSPTDETPPAFSSGHEATLNVPDNWEDSMSFMACYRGRVESIDTGGYLTEGGHVVGEARLDLKIFEVFWGPEKADLTVWIEGVTVPGLIRYDESLRLEQLDYIAPGDEIVLNCTLRSGCWESCKWCLYIVGGQTPVSLTELELNSLRERAERGSLASQAQNAELVCIANYIKPLGTMRAAFEIQVVLSGSQNFVAERIQIYWPYVRGYFKRNPVEKEYMVLFLRQPEGEEVEKGRASLESLVENGWIESEEALLPRFIPLERFGSVLMRKNGTYVNYFGLPTELPVSFESLEGASK